MENLANNGELVNARYERGLMYLRFPDMVPSVYYLKNRKFEQCDILADVGYALFKHYPELQTDRLALYDAMVQWTRRLARALKIEWAQEQWEWIKRAAKRLAESGKRVVRGAWLSLEHMRNANEKRAREARRKVFKVMLGFYREGIVPTRKQIIEATREWDELEGRYVSVGPHQAAKYKQEFYESLESDEGIGFSEEGQPIATQFISDQDLKGPEIFDLPDGYNSPAHTESQEEMPVDNEQETHIRERFRDLYLDGGDHIAKQELDQNDCSWEELGEIAREVVNSVIEHRELTIPSEREIFMRQLDENYEKAKELQRQEREETRKTRVAIISQTESDEELFRKPPAEQLQAIKEQAAREWHAKDLTNCSAGAMLIAQQRTVIG